VTSTGGPSLRGPEGETRPSPRPARRIVRADPHEASVSPLELFFDLVFVFALTQVTAFLADDPTFAQLGRGVLMLALVWWAWSGYTWLTSTVDPEVVLTRLVMFAAMGAMLVLALATPGAFSDDGVLWGVAYIAVRLLHAALFALAARGDPALARNVVTLVVSIVPGGGLILLGALAFDGTTRDLMWLAAVLLDYGIVILGSDAGSWRVHAAHFAERFGLVMIIAFGESIVAIGVGAEDVELGAGEIASALLAVAIVCAMWWAYFDVVAVVAEQRFREAVGRQQLLIARDAYALLHLPMITGVVLFALGVKKVLEHTGDPLKAMPAVALCGGLALYLAAHVGFRLRNVGSVGWHRVGAALVCLALVPLATEIAGVAMLAVLLAVFAVLIAFEVTHYAEARARVRAERIGH
jgi:low temperature requirement protein LtrA